MKELCKIISGEITKDKILNNIKKATLDVLEQKKKVFFCGKMPWIVDMYDDLCDWFGKGVEIRFVDIEKEESTIHLSELPAILDEESVCVICSRAYCEQYYEVLKDFKNVIYYPCFLLATQIKNSNKYGYTYADIVESVSNVIDNAKIYQELLDNLEDEESKNLLCRIILFRLSFDLSLTEGVKSKEVQYWDKNVYRFTNSDIIVDAGGFTGDSLNVFYETWGEQCKEYHLFEPTKSVHEAERYAETIPINVITHNCGLYDYNGAISFALRDGASGQPSSVSQVDKDGEVSISIMRLDSVLKESPTFVKMDIEGSELMALDGSEGIISDHTSFAICAYHKINDIIEIYQWLKKHGNYCFYMRAENNNLMTEFVLFGIAKGSTRE